MTGVLALLDQVASCTHGGDDWCPRCGAVRDPDGQWCVPELVAAMLEHGDDDHAPIETSASTRHAIERLGRWGGGIHLDDAVRELSGPTCALLVVSGLAHIVDGEGPRVTLSLTYRGQCECEHWSRIRSLARVCTCGHDRGEHAAQYPSECGACPCAAFSDAEAVAMIGELANGDEDLDEPGVPAPVVDLAQVRAARVRP